MTRCFVCGKEIDEKPPIRYWKGYGHLHLKCEPDPRDCPPEWPP